MKNSPYLCITIIRICIPKRNGGTRYKTVDMHHYAPKYKTYAEASDTVRRQMERDAVIANVFRKNQTKVLLIRYFSLHRYQSTFHARTLTCAGMHRAWNSASRVSVSLASAYVLYLGA